MARPAGQPRPVLPDNRVQDASHVRDIRRVTLMPRNDYRLIASVERDLLGDQEPRLALNVE
jgi:hypothetical protein